MSEQNEETAPAASLAGFAPAPVSTRLISGSVTVRDYSESWVGDDSDILSPDSVLEFAGIDMTAWAATFLDAVDSLFAPDMAAAIATLDPDRAASLARYKRRLAKVIARTLIPVLVFPGETPDIAPARELFHESLLESLGSAYALEAGHDGPLRLCPPPPAIDEGAITAQSPASIADALLWDYAVTITTEQAGQDELLLSVVPNGLGESGDRSREMAATTSPRNAAAETLFEALARAAFEYPQIAPYLAQVLPGGDAVVARAALDRVDALILDVARTWPDWFARPLPPEPVPANHAPWRYSVDFGNLPILVVTRFEDGDGRLPPWPTIAGFATPVENGQAKDSYQPVNSLAGEALTFTWAKLPLVQVQRMHIAASTRRNANLVPPGSPEGTVIDPAFVYRTAIVAGAEAFSPSAELPSHPIPIGTGAANLSEAIDALFAPFLAAPKFAGLSARAIQIGIEASYRTSPVEGIDIGIPIFLTRNTLALSPTVEDGAIPVVEFRRGVVDALVTWHATAQPEGAHPAIRFAVTLFPAAADASLPLAYLGHVEAPVPVSEGSWWR